MATTSMKKLSIKPDEEVREVSHPVAQKIMSRDYLKGENPFQVPTDQDIFVLRDRERQRKKKEREADLQLPVWDKHTYRTRVERNAAQTRKEILAMDEEEGEGQAGGGSEDKDDTMWTLNVTSSDRKVDREDLTEYVNKKREMFLVQYSLRVKKDEMKKLEDLAVAEEQKLEAAEIYLEEDATMFDEFLKENDRNSVEAIKIAEAETKAKLEKVQEIKRCNATLMSIRSDISKHEEVLKEYILYKKFLEKLTPQEWKDVHLKKKSKKRKEVMQKRKKTPQTPHSQHRHTPTSVASSAASHHPRSKRGTTANSTASTRRGNLRHVPSRQRSVRSRVTHRDEVASLASTADRNIYDDDDDELTSDDDPDEEVKLYFTDPEQLLAIFQELEEDNLSLITNSQETEEAMEELKQTLKMTEKKMSKQTEQLVTQIEVMEATIAREEERADVLEMKCKMFNFGEFQAKDEDEALAFLNAKVEQVYQSCIGDNEANLSSLQMLTSVENRLEELFDQIDRMPPHLVESAEKAKEKERRMRMREEKILQQKLHQEERVRKALERAKADPKRKVGKRLVFRSEPPQRKQKDDKKKDSDIQKEEEDMYFFT